jgi:hypothetical protein
VGTRFRRFRAAGFHPRPRGKQSAPRGRIAPGARLVLRRGRTRRKYYVSSPVDLAAFSGIFPSAAAVGDTSSAIEALTLMSSSDG